MLSQIPGYSIVFLCLSQSEIDMFHPDNIDVCIDGICLWGMIIS